MKKSILNLVLMFGFVSGLFSCKSYVGVTVDKFINEDIYEWNGKYDTISFDTIYKKNSYKTYKDSTIFEEQFDGYKYTFSIKIYDENNRLKFKKSKIQINNSESPFKLIGEKVTLIDGEIKSWPSSYIIAISKCQKEPIYRTVSRTISIENDCIKNDTIIRRNLEKHYEKKEISYINPNVYYVINNWQHWNVNCSRVRKALRKNKKIIIVESGTSKCKKCLECYYSNSIKRPYDF